MVRAPKEASKEAATLDIILRGVDVLMSFQGKSKRKPVWFMRPLDMRLLRYDIPRDKEVS